MSSYISRVTTTVEQWQPSAYFSCSHFMTWQIQLWWSLQLVSGIPWCCIGKIAAWYPAESHPFPCTWQSCHPWDDLLVGCSLQYATAHCEHEHRCLLTWWWWFRYTCMKGSNGNDVQMVMVLGCIKGAVIVLGDMWVVWIIFYESIKHLISLLSTRKQNVGHK